LRRARQRPRGGDIPPPLPEFRADHPFLFFIVDQASGLVLFMGRLAAPSPP
jgi:serpin B